jgi:hypothetical protein
LYKEGPVTRSGIRVCVVVAAAVSAATLASAAPASAAAGVRPCGNRALAVRHTGLDGATGHGSFILLFKNTSRVTCTLVGYPGLDALGRRGIVLAHAAHIRLGFVGGSNVVRTVTVRPGHYASAAIEWMNFDPSNSGDCVFSRSVATTPPHTTHTVTFPMSVSLCDLQVHPVVAGTSGRG